MLETRPRAPSVEARLLAEPKIVGHIAEKLRTPCPQCYQLLGVDVIFVRSSRAT